MRKRAAVLCGAAAVVVASGLTAVPAEAGCPARPGGVPRRRPGLEEVRHRRLPDAPVRVRRGAAGPRRPLRPHGHAGAVAHPAHREEVPGPAAGEPGRSGRQRADARRVRRRVAAEEGRRRVRRRRVRPARRGREPPGPGLRAGPLRRRTPRLGAHLARGGAGQPGPREVLRRGVRAQVRRPAAAHDHDGRRARPGRDPAGAGRGADQLLRLLLRHLPRHRVRQAVPAAGAASGAGLRGRPDGRLVRLQPRPEPGVQRPPPRVHGLGRQARRDVPPRHRRGEDRGRLVRDAGRAQGGPGRMGRSARRSWRTPTSRAATTTATGRTWPRRSPRT